ncbi:MAG: hypothetical protein ABJP48_09615 [Erythrobacter sp.]
MQSLMLHPSCELGPIQAITAEIAPSSQGCEVEFRLTGEIGDIKVPDHKPPARTDDLWKTTCFEIFWQPIGGTYYREFNLSPSSRWAAYDFDGFREGMRDAPVDAIALSCSHNERELVLKASIAAELTDPAQVALNAIVEHHDRSLQFWALAFAPGKPEFHAEACRKHIVEQSV